MLGEDIEIPDRDGMEQNIMELNRKCGTWVQKVPFFFFFLERDTTKPHGHYEKTQAGLYGN